MVKVIRHVKCLSQKSFCLKGIVCIEKHTSAWPLNWPLKWSVAQHTKSCTSRTIIKALLLPARVLLVTSPNCCRNFIFDGELSGLRGGPDMMSKSRASLLASATSSSSVVGSSSLLLPSADFWRAAFIVDFRSNKLTTGNDEDDDDDLCRWRCQAESDAAAFGCNTGWLRSQVLAQFACGADMWWDLDEPCRPTTRFNGVSSAVPAPNFASNLVAATVWCSGRRCESTAVVPFLSVVLRCSNGGGGRSGVLFECGGLADLLLWLAASGREETSNGRWNFFSGWAAVTGGIPPRGGIVKVNGSSLSAADDWSTSVLPAEYRCRSFTDLSRSCNNCCYTNTRDTSRSRTEMTLLAIAQT